MEIAFAEAGIKPALDILSLQDKPEWFTSIVNPLTKVHHKYSPAVPVTDVQLVIANPSDCIWRPQSLC